jgi:LuxR family maltose regulon positive regulatory protein
MAGGVAAARGGARFALSKFRPATLPATLVPRPVLYDRLMAGAGQRLTVVAGSAGAGKTVLLSSWAATRLPGATSWLSCDEADANPVRFWTGFIEAPRGTLPEFGADAADLLAMDGAVSADVTASIANDAAKLPPGSVIVVDDFHATGAAVATGMTDLVERWPAQTAQLVLASRVDPPLRLHRLRIAGQLCELRDDDLYFSLGESCDLLANFGVQLAAGKLALLHQRSEGWAAALQMAALSLRSADPARATRALEIRSHAIAEYFIAEVLEQQPPEVARFMLDTSVLGEMTADACTAVTGRPDAGELLRGIDAAHLFLVALDEERTAFRYHHLVRQLLRAELRARDRDREQALQLRAGEWLESAGDARRAARHFLAARQAGRALALLQDRVAGDYLRDPAQPAPLELSTINPSLLADAPGELLAVAFDLLLAGDAERGGEYLDLLERVQPSIPADSRLAARRAAARSVRHGLAGHVDEAVAEALAVRAVQERTQLTDQWTAVVPVNLLRAYEWREDYDAVEREAAAALATPELAEPVKQVLVPGARAAAWFESGHLALAAQAARAADDQARRLGFGQHFFAVDHLRALAGLALERRDLDTAEQLTEQALLISERGRPPFEFLALLDRAKIWATRGQFCDALATIETARRVLPGAGPVLIARADELEALLRLSAGDPRIPADLASGLPASRRALLLAKIALHRRDHGAALDRLQMSSPAEMTPRHALVRQILLAAAAIGQGDPAAAAILGEALHTARRGGFLHTVVTAAPQVTSYLIKHSAEVPPEPFMEHLIAAALHVRATQPRPSRSRRMLTAPLTDAQLRILRLMPTSTTPQIAATLWISRNTVKSHLRSIYQKLGASTRSEAIEKAVDLQLLLENHPLSHLQLRHQDHPSRAGSTQPGRGLGQLSARRAV